MNKQGFQPLSVLAFLPVWVKGFFIITVAFAVVVSSACAGGTKSSTAYYSTAPVVQTAAGTPITSTNTTSILPLTTVASIAANPIDTGSGDRFTVAWAKPAATLPPYLTFYNSLKYTNDWLWVKQESPDIVRIGFTDYAQMAVGNFWSVDFWELGTVLKRGGTFGFIQGEDTMDVNLSAPVAGVLMSINQAVLADYLLINRYPYDDGWLVTIKMSNPDDLTLLLTAAEYARQCCPPCHCAN